MSAITKRAAVNLAGTVDDLILELENERKERAARKPLTTFDVIRAIHPTLASMKADGWTDTEVCDVLGKRGIVISVGTFATYMKRINKERREGQPKAARKPRGDSRTPTQPAPSCAAGHSPVHRKGGAPDSQDSGAREISRSPMDSGTILTAAPTMAGFTSRKPPTLDA